jgi:hypothetical protein
VGNTTGFHSSSQCTPVGFGFWAPLGSAAPKPCPTGTYCPGFVAPHWGAEPIMMPTGGSTERASEAALVTSMTLDILMDDFTQARSDELKSRLAAQYRVHPSLITLQATAGSLQLTITIATTNGTDAPIDVATLRNQVSAVDSTALTDTIRQTMDANVTITNLQPLEETTVDVTREVSCQKGQWYVMKQVEPARCLLVAHPLA